METRKSNLPNANTHIYIQIYINVCVCVCILEVGVYIYIYHIMYRDAHVWLDMANKADHEAAQISAIGVPKGTTANTDVMIT